MSKKHLCRCSRAQPPGCSNGLRSDHQNYYKNLHCNPQNVNLIFNLVVPIVKVSETCPSTSRGVKHYVNKTCLLKLIYLQIATNQVSRAEIINVLVVNFIVVQRRFEANSRRTIQRRQI